MTIGILDLGLGNIGSLANAVNSQGWDSILLSTPDDFNSITHLIIPGVGSFAYAMNKLREQNLESCISNFAAQGGPVLGICLGMQMLANVGVEGGHTLGLGLISGEVIPIKRTEGLRFPHVGWNDVVRINNNPLLDGIKSGVDFYFVNSYCFSPVKKENVILETEYGISFPAMIAKENVVGMQFHPEKSQTNGLRLLDNFCLWNGIC